jgi:Ni/Fe-hydrogenase subunit HybB-like protein
MLPTKLRSLSPWAAIFWVLVAAGIFSTIYRFTQGLGATTNLHDEFPWGIWIGFDILCGVALAAGGFVVAASVYIFNLDHYRPILRPAILTAFLGYVLVIFALLYDLGRPWAVWHPIVYWNPRSVMFEVGWCVILYTTVLALEFSPMLFERLNLERPKKILHAITVPLVIAGVILSSLHQSSLGSLYLIVPTKLHPLWYSSNLPYLFFLTAVAVGPAMVTVESYYSSRAFRREIEMPILSKLGKVTAVALAVYLVLKVEDIINLKLVPYLFSWNFEAMMYWAEMIIGVVVPIILLINARIRTNKIGLFISSLFVVTGVMLNRLNVSLTAIQQYAPVSYFPSWMEVSVTLMIVALGFAIFRYAAKYLPVFPPEESRDHRRPVTASSDVVVLVDLPTTVRQ